VLKKTVVSLTCPGDIFQIIAKMAIELDKVWTLNIIYF